MENQRTVILAAGLFGLIGLIVIWKGLNSFVLAPAKKKKQELQALDKAIKRLKNEKQRVIDSEAKVKDFTRRSLPPDALDAQRLYKEWIHDIADVVGFDSLVVKPARPERQFIGQGRLRKPLFTAVPISIAGKTTFDRLCRFLYYFHRTDIPHRIADLQITSEENEGNPLLTVKITVEALSLAKAGSRKRIFPETQLQSDMSSFDKTVEVAGANGFPSKGMFRVRIGRNIVTVTERKGKTWKLRPGIDAGPNGDADGLNDASAGNSVELMPVTSKPLRTFADYRRDVFGRGKSPFVLPEPPVIYRPRLDLPSTQRVVRGSSVRFRARARDLNPDKGTARFSLGNEMPKGMTIDEKTGEVSWKPTDKDPSKTYRAEIVLHQGTSQKPLKTGTVRIELRDPNVPPTLEVVTRHSGFLGNEIVFQAKGADKDGVGLRYSLSKAPNGADISATSGRFNWTPSDALDPGDYEFDVVVTDSGGDSARKTVTISLKKNAEKFTKLIACLSDKGKREAWLYDITTKAKTDAVIKLREGEPFEVSGFSGFVYVIGQDFIEFQADGKSYRLLLGRFLNERDTLRPTASSRSKSKPATVTSAGSPK